MSCANVTAERSQRMKNTALNKCFGIIFFLLVVATFAAAAAVYVSPNGLCCGTMRLLFCHSVRHSAAGDCCVVVWVSFFVFFLLLFYALLTKAAAVDSHCGTTMCRRDRQTDISIVACLICHLRNTRLFLFYAHIYMPFSCMQFCVLRRSYVLFFFFLFFFVAFGVFLCLINSLLVVCAGKGVRKGAEKLAVVSYIWWLAHESDHLEETFLSPFYCLPRSLL